MDDLLAAAAAARANAYAPYSGFPVGAALRAASGRIYAGCNVENAAFPQGQCAEASAIGAMVAAGEREIVEVAVVGGGEGLCTPCGGCRQRLAEFAGPETPVHLCGPEGLRADRDAGRAAADGVSGRQPWRRLARVPTRGVGLRRAVGARRWSRSCSARASARSPSEVEEPVAIDYRDLPASRSRRVQGHAGRLMLGRLAGVPVACLQGRAHLYEGALALARAALAHGPARSRDRLPDATNASGSLRPDFGPGQLVLIEDHINLQGINPLVGAKDVGPRFVDMSEVYDPSLARRPS